MVNINPIILIRSPRIIPEVIEEFNKINFIDKAWIKFYDGFQVINKCNEFVRDHPEYTHFVICSDDGIPTVEGLKLLMADAENYDVVSGCCNYCNMWSNGKGICDFCRLNIPHKQINVTLESMTLPLNISGEYFTRNLIMSDYPILTEKWRQENQGIFKVWYQGFAYSFIKRDILLKIPLRPEKFQREGGFVSWAIDDVAFARDCVKNNIDQFVDFRAFFRHLGQHHGKLLVGINEPEIVIERKV